MERRSHRIGYKSMNWNLYVVYKVEDSKGIFEPLFHFKARQVNDEQYEVFDWLGRFADVVPMTKNEIEQKFVFITKEEFEEYEETINEGYTDKIDHYIKRIKEKYQI